MTTECYTHHLICMSDHLLSQFAELGFFSVERKGSPLAAFKNCNIINNSLTSSLNVNPLLLASRLSLQNLRSSHQKLLLKTDHVPQTNATMNAPRLLTPSLRTFASTRPAMNLPLYSGKHFHTSRRLLETPAAVLPLRRPVGAFRGG